MPVARFMSEENKRLAFTDDELNVIAAHGAWLARS
jgi:hypothetical protein